MQLLKHVVWYELQLERQEELLLCGYCPSHCSWHVSWSRPHSVWHEGAFVPELQLLKHVVCAELQSERHVEDAALLVDRPPPVPPLVPVPLPVLPLLHPASASDANVASVAKARTEGKRGAACFITLVCRGGVTSVTSTELFSLYCSKQ